MTRLILVRHAEPLTAGETPGEWPLTEKGRDDAGTMGTSLAGRSVSTVVWTSPERRARETAALAFPLAIAEVRDQLAEVKKPWFDSADDHADAAAKYLRGDGAEGWEQRHAVIARIAQLKLGFGNVDNIVLVTHGLFITTWLDHEMGLDDPFSFWSNLRMPDAWVLSLDENSFEQIL